MQCEKLFCVYNCKNKCRLKQISVNALGMCDDCILISLEEKFLNAEKKKQLEKIESR